MDKYQEAFREVVNSLFTKESLFGSLSICILLAIPISWYVLYKMRKNE